MAKSDKDKPEKEENEDEEEKSEKSAPSPKPSWSADVPKGTINKKKRTYERNQRKDVKEIL